MRALELIAGRYPSATITVPEALPGDLEPIPAGLPSDLVERRPDLVAARERYEAAFFSHEEARAARLPRLALNAGAGRLTSDFVKFKDGLDSTVFPIGAKLLWPLFDAGRLKTAVYIADQQQQEAAANYAKTIWSLSARSKTHYRPTLCCSSAARAVRPGRSVARRGEGGRGAVSRRQGRSVRRDGAGARR